MYAAKKSKTCPDCMASGGKCMAHGEVAKYAEGGEVDAMAPLSKKPAMPGSSEEEHPDREDHLSMPTESPVQQMDSDLEEDLPKVSESLSLAAEVMKDRKRAKFAKGGLVDEMDAPMEDGRESRGLNLEPVHTMSDDEHDESDASLVAQIIKERKARRIK